MTPPAGQYETLVHALHSDRLLPAPGLPAARAHLAAATMYDTNWKLLHYQLLELLHQVPQGSETGSGLLP